MEGAIHVQKHILAPLRIRSLVTKMRQWTVSAVSRVVSLSGKIKITYLSARRANDLIPPVGTIVGAVAFGLWWKSFGAGLFACFALFFLAGVYKATGRIVAAVLRWERDRMAGTRLDLDASATADRSHRDVETRAAIEHLQSWLANETSPTEENVKASCAVLLESVASRNNT
jgi:hypothetical protein